MTGVHTETLQWEDGSVLHIETGRLARQADGSVVLKQGDTMLLATVVAKKEIDPKVDFLPLTVDYQEKYASAGKFPGGFFKRDGRLNEYEILTSRLVDRALRPLFPEDYHADTQVIVSLISSDRDTQGDHLATIAASCAIMCSDLPFPDPVASVRVGYKDGQYIINPKVSQLEGTRMDLMISGTMTSIVMVEGEMQEVSEEEFLGAIKVAHEWIKKINQVQLSLRAKVGKKTREYSKPVKDEVLMGRVRELATARVKEITYTPAEKQVRSDAFKALKDEIVAKLAEENSEWTAEDKVRAIKAEYDMVQYDVMRSMILDDAKRLDGRRTDEIRPIWCEVGYLPRAHGSAIFTRGETQSLTTVTLGSKLDEQTIDYATTEGSKRFMLQYNFPSFSTGEVKPQRGPSRREMGHGNLAERALKVLVPSDVEYTIRVVSDILESNGSSSMATVCAGTMALLDAGIPLKRPASGIAMGLIVEGDKYAILSDILGDEDHLGDMDFKTCGTVNGLTACQMDIKLRGLDFEVLEKALMQAKAGREHILSKMMETISEARPDISQYAPRLLKFDIPSDKIGAVIGSGGKVIQEIQRTTGTTITIEEEGGKGLVTIASANKTALDAAYARVRGIVEDPIEGETYMARVKFLKEAGAVMEFMGGKEGWLHISEISYARIEKMEGTLEVGEEFPVLYIGPDPKNGRLRLSRKALLPKPEGYEERPPRPPRDWGDRGDRGDRGGFRGRR